MAIYRKGKATLDASGVIKGFGTKWTEKLSLIRSGATMVFATNPATFVAITEIVDDATMKAIATGGAVISQQTDYVILLHDSLTVDGLAQDVAETLRYYQGKETQFERFIEIVQNMDPDEMGKWLEGVKAEADRAAAEAGKAHQSSLAAQAASTVSSEQADRAKRQVELAAVEVQKAKDQVGLAAAEVTKAAGEVGKAAQEVEKAKAQVELAQNASDFAQSQAENAAESGGFAKTEADRAAAAAKKAEDLANQFDASKTLLKENNLNDLTDKAVARRNLGVDNITSDDTETRVMTKGKDAWLSLRQSDRKWGFWDQAMSAWHALGVEQGGTGAKDAAGVRKNIGVDRLIQDPNMTRIKASDQKTELRIGFDEWYVYRDSQDSEAGKIALQVDAGGTGAIDVNGARNNFGLGRDQVPQFKGIDLNLSMIGDGNSGIISLNKTDANGAATSQSRMYHEVQQGIAKTTIHTANLGLNKHHYLQIDENGNVVNINDIRSNHVYTNGVSCTGWISAHQGNRVGLTTQEGGGKDIYLTNVTGDGASAGWVNLLQGNWYGGYWQIGGIRGGSTNLEHLRFGINPNDGTNPWREWNFSNNGAIYSRMFIAKDAGDKQAFRCEPVVSGGSGAIIGGAVQGGGWTDWRNQGCGMLVELPSHDSATVLFKAVRWGYDWVCGMNSVIWSASGQSETHLYVGGGEFIFDSAGNGSASTWISRSDIRLKTNLKRIDSATEKLKEIVGYTYYKRNSLKETKNSIYTIEAGIIAQDVEGVLPEAVVQCTGDPEIELKGVNYNGVTALLVNGFNEMRERVENQEEEIKTLKYEIADLKAMIADMQALMAQAINK